MRSHFILFDDFETSDLACFIIPVEFFFSADSSWNLPLLFFFGGGGGGVKKTHFLKDGKTKHTPSEENTRDS